MTTARVDLSRTLRLALALACLLSATSLAQEAVQNPGFEDGSTGWTEYRLSLAPGTSFDRGTVGTAAPHAGSHAYSISNHADGYLESEPVAVVPGLDYDVSGWTRGRIDPEGSEQGWRVRVVFYDTEGSALSHHDAASGLAGTIDSTWRRVGGRLRAPEGATAARVQLHLQQASGWIAYDDVAFKQAPDGSNLLPNPGFEDGATGWAEKRLVSGLATSFWRAGWGTASPRTGSFAYAISNQAYGFLQSDAIAVEGVTDYDVSAWVRGAVDPDASQSGWLVRALFYDAAGAWLSQQDVAQGPPGSLDLGWRRVEGRVTSPPGAVSMRLRLHLYLAAGWVAYDDVEVKRSPDGTNLVTNPGFEEGGGWTENRLPFAPGTSFWRGAWGLSAPRSGSFSYTISNQAYGYLESAPVAVTAGVPYDLSAWVRGEVDPDASRHGWLLHVVFYDPSGAFAASKDVASGGPGTLDATWRLVGGRIIPPAGASSLRVRVYLYQASGWVAWDDVRLLRDGHPGSGAPRDARFVTQSVPAALTPGEVRTVSVTVRNVGSETWTRGLNFRLGSTPPPPANTTWGPHRILLERWDAVAPGQYKTFVFPITAPTTPGDYVFQWRMLQELVEWFGQSTPSVTVRVAPDTTPPLNPRVFRATIGDIDAADAAVDTTTPVLALSWSEAEDPLPGSGVNGYQVVLQRQSDGAWLYSPELSRVTSHTLTTGGLADGESYHYWIRSRDRAGNWASTLALGGTFRVQLAAPAAGFHGLESDYASCAVAPESLVCSSETYSACLTNSVQGCEWAVDECVTGRALAEGCLKCLLKFAQPHWSRHPDHAIVSCFIDCGIPLLEFIGCRDDARHAMHLRNDTCACDYCDNRDPRCPNRYDVNVRADGLQCNEAVRAEVRCDTSPPDSALLTFVSPESRSPDWCHHAEGWSVTVGDVIDLSSQVSKRSCVPTLRSGPGGVTTSVEARFDCRCEGAECGPAAPGIPLVASASCMPPNSYFKLRVQVSDACGNPVGSPAFRLVSWDDDLSEIPLGVTAPAGHRVSATIVEDSGGCFNEPFDTVVQAGGSSFEVTHVRCDAGCARTFSVGGDVEGLGPGQTISVVGRFVAPAGQSGFTEERIDGQGNGAFRFQGIPDRWGFQIEAPTHDPKLRCFVYVPAAEVNGANVNGIRITCFEVEDGEEWPESTPDAPPPGDAGVAPCDPFWQDCGVSVHVCRTTCVSYPLFCGDDLNSGGELPCGVYMTCTDRCPSSRSAPYVLNSPYTSVASPRSGAVGEGLLAVEGWASDADGVADVLFFVDHRQVSLRDLARGLPSPAACATLARMGVGTCDPNGGFAGALDTASLSEGPHVLQVMSVDAHPAHPRPTVLEIPFTVPPADNRPPTARDDAATTNRNAAVVIDVAANDTDPDVDPLALPADPIAPGPANGAAARASATTIRYTPAPDFVGQDSFRYRIEDGCGGADTAAVTVTVRNVAPAAPSGLVSSFDGAAGRIALAWSDNSSDEEGFQVQSSYSGSSFSDMSPPTVGPNVTTYTGGPNPPSGSYQFRVRSFASGLYSDWSNVASLAVSNQAPSTVPGFRGTIGGLELDGLTIEATDPQVHFTWDHASHPLGIARYHIVIQATDGSTGWLDGWQVLYPSTSHTVSISGLVPGKSYSVHIRARSVDGLWGPFASGGAFAVRALPPAAPSGLAGQFDESTRRLTLAWADNSNDEEGFHLQFSYSGSPFADFDPPTVAANVSSYTNGPNPPTGYYQFRVRSTARGVYSAWSNTAPLVVTAPPSPSASIAWIQPAESTWGPAGTLTAAGHASNGSGGVQLVWRERSSDGVWGPWTTVAWQPTPSADTTWSNTISSGNPTNVCHWFEAYVNYSGTSSAVHRYTGAPGCP